MKRKYNRYHKRPHWQHFQQITLMFIFCDIYQIAMTTFLKRCDYCWISQVVSALRFKINRFWWQYFIVGATEDS